LAVAFGATGIGLTPAKSDSTCGAIVCLWIDVNSAGCRYVVKNNDLRKERFDDCPDRSVNDEVSSLEVTSDDYIVGFYADPGAKGKHFCISNRIRGNVPRDMNDKISYVAINGRRNPPPGC
jgi:hypothetical protein